MSERALIWKYELELIDGPQSRPIPSGATVLHVADQYGTVCLWAEVHPGRSLEDRWFTVVGTGHPHSINDGAEYVGTAISRSGALVWHVYEEHGL